MSHTVNVGSHLLLNSIARIKGNEKFLLISFAFFIQELWQNKACRKIYCKKINNYFEK